MPHMPSILRTVRSKGLSKYVERGRTIVSRYGLTPSNMAATLSEFGRLLSDWQCGATFPITAVVVRRYPQAIQGLLAQGIELAVHGYRHIDYSQLSEREQAEHLRRARAVFDEAGIPVRGFRSPYLQFDEHLHSAIEQAGFEYVSNQPILYDVIQDESVAPAGMAAYARAIGFYKPWLASQELALPRLAGRLVQIPVSLPDDEMLLDRLGGQADGRVARVWSRILDQTRRRGELFTLQLHPERAGHCADGLVSLLALACSSEPPVWVARLDQVAAWWRARAVAQVQVESLRPCEFGVSWTGPASVALLVRGAEVKGPAAEWAAGYRRCEVPPVIVQARVRPFVGVAHDTPPHWTGLLRELGYIVEESDEPGAFSIYLDQLGSAQNLCAVIDRIEQSDAPLVKLARWPDRAGSALAITGDIDGLTIADFGLRLLGH